MSQAMLFARMASQPEARASAKNVASVGNSGHAFLSAAVAGRSSMGGATTGAFEGIVAREEGKLSTSSY
eukprot:scaffold37937_cov37-Tisochrysis_lutea.AAC.2